MKALALAVCITIIAALTISACGCITTTNNTASPTTSSTPTPAPSIDYTATLNNLVKSDPSLVLIQPFTKSVDVRGNDAYIGVLRKQNETSSRTHIIERTKSETEAKQLYADAVTNKTNEGYGPSNNVVAPGTSWEGTKLGTDFYVQYTYMPSLSSWVFVTEVGPGS